VNVGVNTHIYLSFLRFVGEVESYVIEPQITNLLGTIQKLLGALK